MGRYPINNSKTKVNPKGFTFVFLSGGVEMQKDININSVLLERIHHNTDKCCNIAILKDWDDTGNKYDDFFNVEEVKLFSQLTEEGLHNDTYFSLNSFQKEKKSEDTLWHINALALDFDFYKIKKYVDFTPEEFYSEVISNILPLPPTSVIDSGRGLYVLYVFKHMPKAMTNTYKAIYKQLAKQYEGYGCDMKATLATQVIRIPGSLNMKSNSRVTVLEFNETDYTIKDFFSILPYEREEYWKRKEDKKRLYERKKEKSPSTIIKRNKFFKSQHGLLIEDFRRLIKLRDLKGVHTGHREILIYLARRSAKKARLPYEKEVLLAEELNDLFSVSLKGSEFRSTKPCGKALLPGIERIIEKLEISAEEQEELTYLCSKRKKDRIKSKTKNRHPIFGLTEKQLEIKMRQAKVFAMKEQLHTNAFIAKKLKEEESTISRDVNKIRLEKWRYKKSFIELFECFKEFIKTDVFIKQSVFSKQTEIHKWMKVCEVVLE